MTVSIIWFICVETRYCRLWGRAEEGAPQEIAPPVEFGGHPWKRGARAGALIAGNPEESDEERRRYQLHCLMSSCRVQSRQWLPMPTAAL